MTKSQQMIAMDKVSPSVHPFYESLLVRCLVWKFDKLWSLNGGFNMT